MPLLLYLKDSSYYIVELLRRCRQSAIALSAFQSLVRIQSFCLRVFALAPSAMCLQYRYCHMLSQILHPNYAVFKNIALVYPYFLVCQCEFAKYIKNTMQLQYDYLSCKLRLDFKNKLSTTHTANIKPEYTKISSMAFICAITPSMLWL